MRWVGYAAALWAFVFGVLHVVWAMGWYVGLDPEQARIAFADAGFLFYDLMVAGACALGMFAVLGLVMPWGRQVPRRVLGGVAWIGSALLVLRAGASIVQAGYLLMTGRFSLDVLGIWEPWFYMGAILFTATTWRFGRRGPC
jgi:hypothetical protein